MFESINPFTEKSINKIDIISSAHLEKKLYTSNKALTLWNNFSLNKKLNCVQNLIQELTQNKQSLAHLMTQEMGKPITQSIAEITKGVQLCEFVISMAPQFLADKKNLPLAPKNTYITYQALGTILGIMPWNFPIWQVLRFALPSLLVGNTVLIKHAPNVMGCAQTLEDLFIKSGFPIGVYQNLFISINQTTQVIKDDRIKGVSVTGSIKAGKAIARVCGEYLKKTVLELGGSDPYLILDSADLIQAAKECAISRMNNNGQSCIAAKRFIVTHKNAEKFITLFKKEMKIYTINNPALPTTLLGPLARKDLKDNLHNQVIKLITQGAEVILGAKKPTRCGYFYPATILKCEASSTAAKSTEELFGPVALIIIVSDDIQAIDIANNSSYGLGAAIFSKNIQYAENLARNIQSGACSINKALHSHPALPFGGIKSSGYGRELSDCGFYEFANIKTIWK